MTRARTLRRMAAAVALLVGGFIIPLTVMTLVFPARTNNAASPWILVCMFLYQYLAARVDWPAPVWAWIRGQS